MIGPGSVVQVRMNYRVLGAVANGRPAEGNVGSVDARRPMLVMSVVNMPDAWRLDIINCDWLVVVLVGARMGWLYDFEIAHAAT